MAGKIIDLEVKNGILGENFGFKGLSITDVV